MTWMWFGGTRSLSSEPPALRAGRGSHRSWCCFIKTHRAYSTVPTAKCSTQPLWGQLCTHSHGEGRSRGDSNPHQAGKKRSDGCGQDQALNCRESLTPFCCNSETGQRLRQSTCCLGTPPPHLRRTNNVRMMLHFSLQPLPCLRRPAAQIPHPQT